MNFQVMNYVSSDYEWKVRGNVSTNSQRNLHWEKCCMFLWAVKRKQPTMRLGNSV